MSNNANNSGGATSRDINAAQRASLALKMRAGKYSYEEIARQVGYSDRGAAHRAVQREMQRIVVKDVEELRREELNTLDQLQAACYKRLIDKKYEKSMLFAVDRILNICERRARLLGLDTPIDQAENTNMVVVREIPANYLAPPVESQEPTS